jgi:hypothetical protein
MEQLQTKSGPTTLLTLPLEIQSKIFSYLTASYGKPNIQAVLRTCKQLYEVALPLSVSVFRNAAPYPKDQGVCSRARNLQFLHYILVSKPWLARHVNTLIAGRFTSDGSDDDDGDNEDQRTISENDLAIYRHLIEFSVGKFSALGPPREQGVSWSAGWVRDLSSSSDAQFALILLTCPNIRTILMEICLYGIYTTHLLILLRQCWNGLADGKFPNNIIPLSNLQDFFQEAAKSSSNAKFFSPEASMLFCSPQLKVYECIGMEGSEEAIEHFSFAPRRSSSVEEITLYQSIFEADALFSILGACKALKRFEVTCYSNTATDLLDAAAARDVLDAVLPHANMLEHLSINLREVWRNNSVLKNTPERLYMGTRLREMHALKTLTAGMQALTGMLAYSSTCDDIPLRFEEAPRLVDCLPDNLESLTIHACGPQISDQLEELVEIIAQGDRFKKLTYIVLLYHAWKVNTKGVPAHFNKMWESVRDKLAEKNRILLVHAGLQCEQAFLHDANSTWADNSDRPGEMMSRIYAPNFRRLFLQRRMNPMCADFEYLPPYGPYDPVLLAS